MDLAQHLVLNCQALTAEGLLDKLRPRPEWASESVQLVAPAMLQSLAPSRDRQCPVTAPYSMKCLPVQISPWSGLRKKLISYWHSSWNCEALLGQQCVTPDWDFIFNAYGYGTPSERQDIMPQIEQELHECSMLKLVQFFRYFLCSDDFEAFASKLYDWIQAAQPKSNEALSAGTEEPDNQSEPLHYLDRDKLQLLQMFRCLLESEARSSCTPFERRLRAELLEQALMPAEAEQVAGLIYDSLLPAEVDAWNRKLHEESIDAYWMPS